MLEITSSAIARRAARAAWAARMASTSSSVSPLRAIGAFLMIGAVAAVMIAERSGVEHTGAQGLAFVGLCLLLFAAGFVLVMRRGE